MEPFPKREKNDEEDKWVVLSLTVITCTKEEDDPPLRESVTFQVPADWLPASKVQPFCVDLTVPAKTCLADPVWTAAVDALPEEKRTLIKRLQQRSSNVEDFFDIEQVFRQLGKDKGNDIFSKLVEAKRGEAICDLRAACKESIRAAQAEIAKKDPEGFKELCRQTFTLRVAKTKKGKGSSAKKGEFDVEASIAARVDYLFRSAFTMPPWSDAWKKLGEKTEAEREQMREECERRGEEEVKALMAEKPEEFLELFDDNYWEDLVCTNILPAGAKKAEAGATATFFMIVVLNLV
jgi:uncharacterized protein (DUF2267 family)/stalled ribosome alternative rescue factor ArfA